MPVLEERALPPALAGGYMPAIEMYPPSGMALKPYCVSPNLRDQIVGPNPIMYWLTFTPKRLAGTRWPTSCSPIETANPSTTMTMPST